ncbi:thioredoxin-like protein [Lineolata rhizophorae]|uniref:Thioredoxin-like protein n=1 Tax=Lineolata rhizophorae TaxID=578093 RepID=A0A6A6P006_9PEZI|nr:thioredoxin-like protein [Lineolata rhizophorae]
MSTDNPVDPAVARVLDHRQHPTTDASSAADDDDADALIAALEEEGSDDGGAAGLRERRVAQLARELAREKEELSRGSGGEVVTVSEEREVLEGTTGTKRCVVHFFKPEFGRCKVMDGRLEALAPKHLDTRFLRINVEHAPFLVTRLKVQVLPCVISFVDGISVDRIIGFEGLGLFGDDRFSTRDLEARLLKSGVLVRAKIAEDYDDGLLGGGSRRKKAVEEEEDDDDWD